MYLMGAFMFLSWLLALNADMSLAFVLGLGLVIGVQNDLEVAWHELCAFCFEME
jgi:hypothetical protein